MGFEPMPLSRLAPKASALTTRPNLQLTTAEGANAKEKQKQKKVGFFVPAVPGGTRTPNPQIRSLMRYPLRHWDQFQANTLLNQSDNGSSYQKQQDKKYSTTVGFEPTRAKPINLAG
jgi:hypothetical protein